MERVAPGAGFNLEGFRAFLTRNPELENGLQAMKDKEPRIYRFLAGQSNPTFKLEVDGSPTKYVLRRKPDGKLLQGAHQVDREFNTMSRLYAVDYPVPRPVVYCESREFLGTEFYIMEFVEGRVFRDMSLPNMAPQERSLIYKSLIEVLAKLHSYDPHQIGLGDLTKSNTPYVKRQVRAWYNNYNQSKIVDYEDALDVVMKELHDWIMGNIPAEKKRCVVHGDFKLDNVIYHPTEPRVVAVLDWEIVSLGDPLADLSYCFQGLAVDPFAFQGAQQLVPGPFDRDTGKLVTGMPTEEAVLWEYCTRSGIVTAPIEGYEMYRVYALFRTACILRGIQARFVQGNAASPLAKGFTTDVIFRYARLAADYAVEAEQRNHEIKYEPSIARDLPRISSIDVPKWRKSRHATQNLTLPPPMSRKARAIYDRLVEFMETEVYPNEDLYERQMDEFRARGNPWCIPPIVEELKVKAKAQGLWNLFRPELSGITNAEYAVMAELMGRNLWVAECFNCQFPDTGNMEVFLDFANEEQKKQWQGKLLEGEIRSAFVMTEPEIASSAATSIATSIAKTPDGKHYVINGNKWWISNGGDPRLKILLLLGNTSMNAPPGKTLERHRQHSVVLVPVDTPGVSIKTPMTVYGYDDAPHGHFEVEFKDVKVPSTNLLWEEGRGFEIAQSRLGPGRIHHCMRTIGLAERSLELMLHRVLTRKAATPFSELGTIRKDIADCRIAIDQTRLLTLAAAHQMDTLGAKEARKAISMIKVEAPRMALDVIDKAIQVHGGVGLSHQFPLAKWFARTRTVVFMDGPSEVHRETIAKLELRAYKASKL